MGVVVETALDTYRRNGLATTLAMPRYSDPFPCMYVTIIPIKPLQFPRNLFTLVHSTGCTIPAVHSIPRWLKDNGYKTPTDGKDSPFTLGFNTNLHFFEFISANPKIAVQFNNLMSAYHQGRPSWMDTGFYPVREQLLTGLRDNPEEVLLVDVGGNKGHDMEEFRAKVPEARGRLILQDLPEVVSEIKNLDAGFETVAHDFYKEQPVKGKLVFFFFFFLLEILFSPGDTDGDIQAHAHIFFTRSSMTGTTRTVTRS